MYQFDGISIEALMLLEENRFNNSKAFYDKNKERIKKLAVNPMRQIAAAVAPVLAENDSLMNTVPTKMVSRVRRDTRFTKDKSLYRQNLWVSFERPKADFPHAPGFWFEISPSAYSYGMGIYRNTPALMQCYRDFILENPASFRKALKSAEGCNLEICGESYKRPKEGNPPKDLEKFYNLKEFYFFRSCGDLGKIQSDAVIDELMSVYKKLIPMYNLLIEIMQKSEKGE